VPIELLIEFKQKSSDSLHVVEVIFLVGKDEIDQEFNQFQVFVFSSVIGHKVLRNFVYSSEIGNMELLMNDLAFFVEECIEGSKAIKCLDKLVIEAFVATDSHLDKVDCNVYDFNMQEGVNLNKLAA
jgi:hypothetical protein